MSSHFCQIAAWVWPRLSLSCQACSCARAYSTDGDPDPGIRSGRRVPPSPSRPQPLTSCDLRLQGCDRITHASALPPPARQGQAPSPASPYPRPHSQGPVQYGLRALPEEVSHLCSSARLLCLRPEGDVATGHAQGRPAFWHLCGVPARFTPAGLREAPSSRYTAG